MTELSSDASDDFEAFPRRWWRGFTRWYWQRRRAILLIVLVGLFAGVMLSPFMLITVPPGHLGVLWLRFFGGTVTDRSLGEGLHLIFPWNRIYSYDGRLQAHSATYDAVSKDGLSLQVDVTFRWRPLRPNIGALHRDVGPNYLNALLVPEIGSVAREALARHDWQALASERRLTIQQEILETVTSSRRAFMVRLAEPATPSAGLTAFDYVGVKDVLISTIVLPAALRGAIERKLDQSQIAEEYRYRLVRETLESERKAIEANGIRTFQQTVQSGISETYLKWRGIEATLELARSPNAKVVVIGGNGGLPIILNSGSDMKDGTAPPPQNTQSRILPNRPNDSGVGPNVPMPLQPVTSPNPPAPSEAATAAPSDRPPDIIEQLGATLSRAFGWETPPREAARP